MTNEAALEAARERLQYYTREVRRLEAMLNSDKNISPWLEASGYTVRLQPDDGTIVHIDRSQAIGAWFLRVESHKGEHSGWRPNSKEPNAPTWQKLWRLQEQQHFGTKGFATAGDALWSVFRALEEWEV